ncbi:MAG: DegV family protein [Dehalococcoidales bacterium]|nr:DegV family protein [Dehalococcoidales bacterium]
MPEVAILTDTVSCLPEELVKEYRINIIPVGLTINRKIFLDTEITNEEFWKLFYQAQEPVTTTAANPSDFENIFTALSAKTDNICCIPVSMQLSATGSMAAQAREAVLQKFPSLKIEIVDSKTATGAEGFIVLEAARAAAAGKSLSEVVATAQDMAGRVKFLCAMQTLKYVVRSGRAPRSALIGDWLKAKPILGMVSGTGLVENLGRARGMDKAIARMVDMVKDYADTNKPLHLMVHYSDDKTLGEKIKETMLSRYNCREVYFTPYTPVMTSQTGPVVAVAFYADR